MMKTKTKWRIFTIADYEREGKWLRSMHAQGWKFVGFNGFFHFEECQPEDVVYKLDYCQLASEERDSYVQLFTDYGWEYIDTYVNFSYFRKPAKDVQQEEEGDLYNPQSKTMMMQRIARQFAFILLSMIFSGYLFWERLLHRSFGKELFYDAFYILLTGFYLFIAWLAVRFLLQYVKLKREFSKS
ncbi:DUF2812 domain-containing protein [Streptococcus massiliensis]|uniref:Protein of uncharacterized function (DUF2812) n=1 Tax=Streptococcus massiliensis TaxID=313439 RepID=A0A380KYY9_9STRE|nr:DUF2812 domain-containing protein [Streptococcus massiliensis]SUN76499.1 Protein of uncharacterised function (DUF2812) [Streptococcus massiliensis]